jgi:Cell division protein 48 (CDC48), N-terminal domain
MKSGVISVRVLAAYADDIERGVVRIDHHSMDSLGIAIGDLVEIIGKKDGMDARCYPLLPSDEGQGITRVDPAVRKMIGVTIDETVMIRKIAADTTTTAAVSHEKSETMELNDADVSPVAQPAFIESTASEVEERATTTTAAASSSHSAAIIVLSGSSTDFEKERPKIMHFITTLESATRSKSKCRCYSDGKKALGWDFFLLEMDEKFVDKLHDIYPDIEKQEADSREQRLALWMNKQLRKMMGVDFHLKLRDVPQEQVRGFRLNPEHYRDNIDLEDLR